MAAFCRAALSRFLVLYGALYAAFGVQSPYLPSLLDSRNLPPEAIALVLAAGTARKEPSMPKMIFVNLPVADAEKSPAFYEAVGFTPDHLLPAGSRGTDELVLHSPLP